MIDVKLLATISETAGAPGFENRIRNFIKEQVAPYVDEVSIDAMGNLIALKKGKDSSKRTMVAAHLDEIGFIVTDIDKSGFVRFHTLGGFDPKTLTAQRVILHGKKDLVGVMGSKPIHVMSPEDRNKPPKISDFFIDLGLPKEEVEKYIEVGTPITRQRELIEMGDCVNGKSLDNRISVFILLEALKELKNTEVPYDVYGVFTVQEEIGIRGAMVAGHHIEPHFSFGLDTTIAFDLPGSSPHEQITKMGSGTAIKILDGSTVCDTRMVRYMKETADKNKIEWQPEILTAGGTDTAGMQRMAKYGTIAGAISIPTRHIHQVIEMCSKKDVRLSIDLLKACLSELDSFNWEHL
ncbi:MAG: M42 family metallopeptidase [Chitinophagales bacterium]|nr:M42 family metallopeptidase [Chitinophagales bacterium]